MAVAPNQTQDADAAAPEVSAQSRLRAVILLKGGEQAPKD